jgi:hypothetical protein
MDVLGSVSLSSNEGITFTTAESKQLKVFIAFGVISNLQIKQVYVNNNLSNIMNLGNEQYLWYYTQKSSFDVPLKIEGLNRNGKVVYKI